MSCVGCRHSLDPALLWLWCRVVATAPTRPLPWEPPYVVGAALEKTKKKKKKEKKKKKSKSLKIKTEPAILTLGIYTSRTETRDSKKFLALVHSSVIHNNQEAEET